MAEKTPEVVIIGGGFGGLYAAKAFDRAPVNLTLLDRRNFHLFQPLLYQVATGGLSPANISAPLRDILKRQSNTRVLLAEVTSIDVGGKRVLLREGEPIPYDFLIVAAGARHHYFGRPDWEPFAPGLKTIEDATEIRRRVLLAFERAERATDPKIREAELTFVIVGAGPTGVEMAGAISELAHIMDVPVEVLRDKVNVLQEFNPMLGHRGCRLGISFPEITEMQAQAIFEAACELRRDGKNPFPEVMIPLVGSRPELHEQKQIVERVALATQKAYGVKVRYLIGTMIELPRACMVADEIAEEAEFFSFGTNDLTQTCLGLSRDDAGKFLPSYVLNGILPEDPFVSIDRDGVGALMKIAIKKGRKTRKTLEIGICGEHGGDPKSVVYCHQIGLDYVSCSPYRVAIARLAAAQAVLGERSP